MKTTLLSLLLFSSLSQAASERSESFYPVYEVLSADGSLRVVDVSEALAGGIELMYSEKGGWTFRPTVTDLVSSASGPIYIGNGGDGLMLDGDLYLTDLYLYGLHLDPYVGDEIEAGLKKTVDPAFAMHLDLPLELLLRKLTDLERLSPKLGYYVWEIIKGYSWEKVPGEAIEISSPVKAKGIALRYLKKVRIYEEALSRMNDKNRLALVIHEVFSSMLNPYCTRGKCFQNASLLRHAVAYAFNSKSFLSPDPLDVQKNLKFGPSFFESSCQPNVNKVSVYKGNSLLWEQPVEASTIKTGLIDKICSLSFDLSEQGEELSYVMHRRPYRPAFIFYETKKEDLDYLQLASSIAFYPGVAQFKVGRTQESSKLSCYLETRFNLEKWFSYLGHFKASLSATQGGELQVCSQQNSP